MTNLWSSESGRAATREAVLELIRDRISRFFGRNFVVEFNRWVEGGKTAFSFIDVLGELNDGHDEEILNLYELLTTLGLAEITMGNVNLYVNEVSEGGSDENGIGTEESPFATVGRALKQLENTYIQHQVNILVSGNGLGTSQTVYTDDILFVAPKIGNGSLNIVGVGAAVETKPTANVNSSTALGNGGYVLNTLNAQIPNAWIGEFIYDANNSYSHAVHLNDANNLYFHDAAGIPGGGVDFTGVIPAVKIELNALSIEPLVADRPSAAYGYSKISFVNISFDFTGTLSPDTYFSCTGAEFVMDFCTVEFSDAKSYDAYIQGSFLNSFDAFAHNLKELAQSGVENIGLSGNLSPGVTFRRETKGLSTTIMMYGEYADISKVTLPGKISFSKGTCTIGFTAMVQAEATVGDTLQISRSLISGDAGSGVSVSLVNTNGVMFGAYFMLCASCIETDGSRLSLQGVACDVLCTNALLCSGITQCTLLDAQAGFQGTNNIRFRTVNPAVNANWPALNTAESDGMVDGGANVTPAAMVWRKS